MAKVHEVVVVEAAADGEHECDDGCGNGYGCMCGMGWDAMRAWDGNKVSVITVRPESVRARV